MNIKERINSDLKIALLAGDKDRVTTLRGLKSVILNAEIAANKRQDGLSDEELVQILNKEVKKRVESAQLYTQGGSPERAEKELEERNVISAYLPAQLSDDELLNLVNTAIAEVQPEGIKDMGKVIALVRERAAGQAEGGRIATITKDRIQEST